MTEPWVALRKVANFLFLLSLLPWALFLMASYLFMDAPDPRGFEVLHAILWSYPITVVAANAASGIVARRDPRLAALVSLLPALYFLGFSGYSAWGTRRQQVAIERDRTDGNVYPCSDGRVLKVRPDGSVWQLQGKRMAVESVVGYLSADGKAFRYGGIEADLRGCGSAGGKSFLDTYPAVSHIYTCGDGSRLRLDAYGEGDFVHLVDARLPEKVFFGRVTRGTQLAFVYDEKFGLGPHKDDAARRAHTLTCRNEQGRTLLDFYQPGASERLAKSR